MQKNNLTPRQKDIAQVLELLFQISLQDKIYVDFYGYQTAGLDFNIECLDEHGNKIQMQGRINADTDYDQNTKSRQPIQQLTTWLNSIVQKGVLPKCDIREKAGSFIINPKTYCF